MSTINTILCSFRSQYIGLKHQEPGVKTKFRYWILALAIFLTPAFIQQAEARKAKGQDYCIENGCKGDKCIACQR